MMLCYSKIRKIKYFLDPPKKAQGYERSRYAYTHKYLSIQSARSAYCCIYHNTSNGDKIVMKCVAFFMFILYIFSHDIYGDNGRIYQIKIYKKMLITNYGCVGATNKFTSSDTVSVLHLLRFSFS